MHGCNDIIELTVVTYTHCHLVGSFSEHLLIYEVVVQSEESQSELSYQRNNTGAVN